MAIGSGRGVVDWWWQRGQAKAEVDVDSDQSRAHFRSSSLSDPCSVDEACRLVHIVFCDQMCASGEVSREKKNKPC